MTIRRTGEAFMSTVAALFPVASYSDEFYFFPQAATAGREWSRWDDFSDEAVGGFMDRCRAWERSLGGGCAAGSTAEAVDARCLAAAVQTLREQLEARGPHRRQPTFHLTIAAAGLVEAVASGEAAAWRARTEGLPAFLGRARALLRSVPRLFLAAGISMAADLSSWLKGLPEGARAGRAVEEFAAGLGKLRSGGSFLLPPEQYDRLLRRHFGCGVGVPGAMRAVEEELGEMRGVLAREAELLGAGRDWHEAARRTPRAKLPPGGAAELYRREADKMKEHCLLTGLELTEEVLAAPLKVEKVPPFLEAVRVSDAYQAFPGHPPRGGVLFVRPRPCGAAAAGPAIEYRMTCAHETWPGHHLLDACRWSGARPLRRPLERPLYYEGWACLAEELMAATGYFDERWDRFILARRRLRRAVRGKVDMGLQTGTLTGEEATALLVDAGFSATEAAALVPKFALRPGYQVCYTLGLKRFLPLQEKSAQGGSWVLARKILTAGEIDFDELERQLDGRGA